MEEPEPGTKRVRLGRVQVWQAERQEPPKYGGDLPWTNPAHWEPTDEVVGGARFVHLYSEMFSERDVSIRLAPHERVVGIEYVSGGQRLVWIEQSPEDSV